MSEYMGMSVSVGGRLPKSKLDDFRAACEESFCDYSPGDGVTTRAYIRDNLVKKKGEPKYFYVSDSTNYGSADEIFIFCRDNGLTCIHCVEAKYEYNGSFSWVSPDGTGEGLATQGGEPVIWCSAVEAAFASLKKLKKDPVVDAPLMIGSKNKDVAEIAKSILAGDDLVDALINLLRKKMELPPEVPALEIVEG